MLTIGIITGSTRDGRVNRKVADYILEVAQDYTDEVTFDILDIIDYDLPLVNGTPPGMLNRQYPDEKVLAWSKVVDQYDGFIFVTAEYNRLPSPALANAIDVLQPEWSNKASAIAGYGSTGGISAIQTLRLMLANVGLAVIGQAADYNIFTEFEDGEFKPFDYRKETLEKMFSTLISWTKAMKQVREEA